VGTLAACFREMPWLLATLAYSQCGLLGWWVGVTRVRTAWKLAGWCLGTASLFALLSHPYVTHPMRTIPWNQFEWIGYSASAGAMITSIAPLALAFLVVVGRGLGRRGIYLRTPFGSDDAGPATVAVRGWQFGLGDLFLTTFTAAVTLGLIALTAPYPAWILELPVFWCRQCIDFHFGVVFGLMALDITLVTFVAAWATLGNRLLSWRLGWVALAAAVWPLACAAATMAVLVYSLEVDLNGELGWERWPLEAYFGFFSRFACVAASFLLVRLAGWRWVCVRNDDDKTENQRRDLES